VTLSQPGKKAQGLGAQLRAIRKLRRMSMQDVADRLGWSESKVSRLETGQRPLSSEEVSSLLAILDVTGETRDRLMAMARTPEEPGWLETVRSALPDESVTLSTYEAEATKLTDWSPLLIPGLLQTMEYGRAFMLADRIAETDIGTRLMARQHRQQLLDRVEYTAFIDETVLHRRIGDERVRRGQLRHLLDMAERDNVTVRLVSVNSDAHSGLISPFLMIEFELTPPIVHIELARSGVFLSDESETRPYTETIARLSSMSMEEADSVRAIEAILGEKGTSR
jgi:transcriptional regulator with XRE-family HTH domain